MANPEHVKILEQGVDVWNKWREDNEETIPDLSEVNFQGKDLSNIIFIDTNLMYTNLSKANLTNGDLYFANLTRANLQDANLSYADLSFASIITTDASRANFYKAKFLQTSIVNSNLNSSQNLDTCLHVLYSNIDFHTLIKSKHIPVDFLHGCGLPEKLINFIYPEKGSPLQFYSSFISHSSKDKPFVEKLHSDLQGKGIRCWYAPEDLKIGDKIRHAIEGAIKVHDKLMIILSESSINSQWVENEVEAALAREQKENKVLLFPIMLDKSVFDTHSPWAATIQRTRNIGDFTNWKDHDSYTQAFERLLRDLKKSEE